MADKIEIQVIAKGLDAVKQDIKGLQAQMEKTGKQSEKSANILQSAWVGAAAAVVVAIAGVKKAMDFSKEGAKIQQSMEATANQFGISIDKMLSKLREASAGTVADSDLISSANRAMALNVTKDMDKMAQLMEVARARGKAMGLDTTEAFSDIVTGIGRACLVPDTLVWMGDGSYKKIVDVNSGDLVKSFNKDGEIVDCEVHHVVKNGYHDVYKIECDQGHAVTATENHKFLTQRGWVLLKDIKKNKDSLRLDNKKLSKVVKIKYISKSDVYDIAVPAFENFFANCVNNHNSPLILDNLGIITKGWTEEAKAAGKAFDAQFILNKVLADGASIVASSNPKVLSLAEKMQALGTQAQNAGDTVKRAFAAETIILIEKMGDESKNALDKIRDGMVPIRRTLRVIVALIQTVGQVFATAADFVSLEISRIVSVVSSASKVVGLLKDAVLEVGLAVEQVKKGNFSEALESIKQNGITTFQALKTEVATFAAIQTQMATDFDTKTKESWASVTETYRSAFGEISDMSVASNETRTQSAIQSIHDIAAEEAALRALEVTASQKHEKQKLAIRQLATNSAKQLTTNFFSFVGKMRSTELSNTLKSIDKEKEAGLASLKDQGAGEVELQAFREKMDKKVANAKRRAAIRDKAQAISQSLINTALAITSVFAQAPGGAISKGIQAAIIGGLGAAQTAFIAAQPLPQFAQGTGFSPGGRAIVGERGPEIVDLPQGSNITPNSQITNETFDNREITINVQANDPIDLVNQLRQTYGLDVFAEA